MRVMVSLLLAFFLALPAVSGLRKAPSKSFLKVVGTYAGVGALGDAFSQLALEERPKKVTLEKSLLESHQTPRIRMCSEEVSSTFDPVRLVRNAVLAGSFTGPFAIAAYGKNIDFWEKIVRVRSPVRRVFLQVATQQAVVVPIFFPLWFLLGFTLDNTLVKFLEEQKFYLLNDDEEPRIEVDEFSNDFPSKEAFQRELEKIGNDLPKLCCENAAFWVLADTAGLSVVPRKWLVYHACGCSLLWNTYLIWRSSSVS